MQQDENQKVAMAIVSPTEDRAIMSRTRGSLRQQRVDARQRMEGSAARDALQQKRMELTGELHETEIACVSEQCQARTSRLDGTLTQNAWQTTLLVIKSHVKEFRTETANVMNRGTMFPLTAGRQASHISDTKGRM